MMFSKTLAVLAAPLLAVATSTVSVAPQPTSTPASSCSTGDLQCCNSLESATDPTAAGILALLGVVVQGVDVVAGLTCDPISVVGISGGSCSANAVCCSDNSFGKLHLSFLLGLYLSTSFHEGNLISLGCVPVTL